MLRAILYSLIMCLLAACGGSDARAPVEDRRAQKADVQPNSVYYVQKSETLYSIAFRFGLDYRKLAAANGVKRPYTIYPGQKLRLTEKAPVTVAAAPASTAKKTTATKPAPKVVPAKSTTTAPKPKPKSKPTASTGSNGWRWPSSGSVVRKYSASLHKGVDISGKRGDPVIAVKSGRVVYSGTGIVGFGELLIIKHSDIYLSAYGHNDRLLVAEGDEVKAGQKIAEKGSSGTDKVKLHFEIRREGKPIDPLGLLPRR